MGASLSGGTRRTVLAQNISALTPDGATGLYDTIAAAVKTLRATYDPGDINAVVLLTDGRNEILGGLALRALLSQLTDPAQPQVRVFTIAYGSQADQADVGGRTVLQEISAATRAREYDAKDPTTISSVLTAVISNF
jgi:Ca-activated chloride channel family protein